MSDTKVIKAYQAIGWYKHLPPKCKKLSRYQSNIIATDKAKVEGCAARNFMPGFQIIELEVPEGITEMVGAVKHWNNLLGV